MTQLCCSKDVGMKVQVIALRNIQGSAKKNGATGHPISLQIFRKLHDRIAWRLVDFVYSHCTNRFEHHTVAVFSLGGAR